MTCHERDLDTYDRGLQMHKTLQALELPKIHVQCGRAGSL